MSRSHFTIEGSWRCFTIATLFNPVVGHDHLGHGGHVQHVLAVVLLGEIDVVEEEGEVFEHPLGKVEHFNKTFLVVLNLGQVHVDGGAHQEAHVEHRLSHLGTNSCWQRCPFQGKKYKKKFRKNTKYLTDRPATLHQPTVLCVLLRALLICVLSHL